MSVRFDRHRKSHRMSHRAAIAVAAALLFSAPAFAEDTKPAAPAAAAPATVPEPTASHLAAARELVLVSGMSRSFSATVPQMLRQLSSTIAQTRPELMADLNAVIKDLTPDFDKDTDKMVDKAAHIYARFLSEDEIKAAVAFFISEPGKKYVQAEPLYFNAVINAMQDWHDELQADLMTKVRAEMKKRGKPL